MISLSKLPRFAYPILTISLHPDNLAVAILLSSLLKGDFFTSSQFTGPRLDAFLTLLDLLLPFDHDSRLGVRVVSETQGQATVAGPAHYIEQWTDGILREIMVLVMDASLKALETKQPCLTVDILNRAWHDIKRAKVVNFLDHLRAQNGGFHD